MANSQTLPEQQTPSADKHNEDIDRKTKDLIKLLKLSECKEHSKVAGELESFLEKYSLTCIGENFHLFSNISNVLSDEQKKGVVRLWKWHCDKRGGILANDSTTEMIYQVTTFLIRMFDMDKIKTVLIVSSEIKTWLARFKKWTCKIKVSEYKPGNKNNFVEDIHENGGVLLVTHRRVYNAKDQLKQHKDDIFMWDYIVVDDGNQIKNDSQTTEGVNAISAKNHIILTDSSIKENQHELWNLFRFVGVEGLPETEIKFNKMYKKPIQNSKDKEKAESADRELREITEPYILYQGSGEIKSDTSEDSTQEQQKQIDHVDVKTEESLKKTNDGKQDQDDSCFVDDFDEDEDDEDEDDEKNSEGKARNSEITITEDTTIHRKKTITKTPIKAENKNS